MTCLELRIGAGLCIACGRRTEAYVCVGCALESDHFGARYSDPCATPTMVSRATQRRVDQSAAYAQHDQLMRIGSSGARGSMSYGDQSEAIERLRKLRQDNRLTFTADEWKSIRTRSISDAADPFSVPTLAQRRQKRISKRREQQP